MSKETPYAVGGQQGRPLSHYVALAADVLWRRFLLVVLPMLVIVPLAIAFVKFGPRPYVSQALMLLQENSRESPLSRESIPTYVNVQDRVNGLQALLRSERVLGAALIDIYGKDALADPRKAEALRRQLTRDLNLYLVGNEFVMMELKHTSPTGLGKQLEIILTRFLQALLPADDAQIALQDINGKSPGLSTMGIAPSVLKAPERIKLIDVPRDPVLPATSGLKIVLAAFAVSLLAGIGLAAVAELLDGVVRHQAQFEQITGLPVLARLPGEGGAEAATASAATPPNAGKGRAPLLTRVVLLLTFLGASGSALGLMGDAPNKSDKGGWLAAWERGGR